MATDRTAWSDERIDDMVAALKENFDRIDRRFDAIEKRFDLMDGRFELLHEELRTVRRDISAHGWRLATAAVVAYLSNVVAIVIALA
jgi:hypothetical protein